MHRFWAQRCIKRVQIIVDRIIDFCYKWLPVFFACHCRPERSFFFRGRQFPVCARCTGIMTGMLLFALSCWWFRPPFRAALILIIPLIADGTIQKKTSYESTNIRRLITGTLFGYSICWLAIEFLLSGFRYGMLIGEYFISS